MSRHEHDHEKMLSQLTELRDEIENLWDLIKLYRPDVERYRYLLTIGLKEDWENLLKIRFEGNDAEDIEKAIDLVRNKHE